MNLILTVQSTANNWRLGINKPDSISLFKHRELLIIELNSNTIIECRCACGTGKKKAFDINSKVLSEWIVKNSFHKYPNRRPTKLLFSIKMEKEVKSLTYKSTKPL